MCTVCFATQTFDPMRHGNGPDPLLQNIFEDVNAPDGISTTNSMAVGDSFLGTINGSGDEDWVSITLTAGESYDISLAGTGTATENPDPYLYIYDANGTLVTSNDDSGGTRDSFINFDVTTRWNLLSGRRCLEHKFRRLPAQCHRCVLVSPVWH